MIQKTIIATLLALLSGAPFLKAQTMDTTSVDTLISITDSLIGEVIREIKKEIKDEASNITDDTRIQGAVPSIRQLLSGGAKLVLCSHLGRPKGGFEAKVEELKGMVWHERLGSIYASVT